MQCSLFDFVFASIRCLNWYIVLLSSLYINMATDGGDSVGRASGGLM